MTEHTVVAHDEWLAARTALLAKEKEFTRLPRRAQPARGGSCPGSRSSKEYVFDGPRRQGDARRALRRTQPARRLPLHVRAGVGRGLPALLVLGRQLRPERRPPEARDVTMVAVSRAPLGQARSPTGSGWAGASTGSRRSATTSTTTTASRSRPSRCRTRPSTTTARHPGLADREGVSVFAKDERGRVFHTYSAYARGIDLLNAAYTTSTSSRRDATRRAARPQFWVRRHDEYGR